MSEDNKSTIYEFSVLGNKYRLTATNKLTAYAAMCLGYDYRPHLVVIHKPESSRQDSWFGTLENLDNRLNEVFGGDGSFGKYLKDNYREIIECWETIELVK